MKELRDRLEAMTTEELVDVLRAYDLNEWRAEVFPIVESILRERGVDAVRARSTGEADSEGSEPQSLVRVMDLPNAAVVAVARSLLEEGGFRFLIRNEGTQSLFGWAQMGAGYNLITGPPVLMVEASRAEEARELLEALRPYTIPRPQENDT